MKIVDQVYVLESTAPSYCYLLKLKEKEWALVDTCFSFVRKAMLSEIKELGIELNEIKHILLTHYDVDHMGNVKLLEEMTGAKVWASEAEIPYIMGEKPRPSFKNYFAKILRPGKPKEIKAYGKEIEDLGIEVIKTPGHSPGHVCLLYHKVLFTGDLVKNEGGKLIPYPKGWNWQHNRLLESIEKVKAYSFDWIAVAHGKPCERKDILV